MTFLGVWACQWRELKPISFGGTGPNRQADESGVGYIQGSGRGRGPDGAGAYEMV
jgi:protein SYS1